MDAEIRKPMPFSELGLVPPFDKPIKLSESMQQTLALLSGFDGEQRKLIKVSPTGSLYACSPPLKGLVVAIADGDADDWVGDDIPTTEIMLKQMSGNAGLVYWNIRALASAANGWQLSGTSPDGFSIRNLRELNLHFTKNGDKVVIVYTE